MAVVRARSAAGVGLVGLVALSLAGCEGGCGATPPRGAAPPGGGAVVAPSGPEVLGDPLGQHAAAAEPALTVDASGAPVCAFTAGGDLQVWRKEEGKSWAQLGAAPIGARQPREVQLAAGQGGELFLAWAGPDARDRPVVAAARWDGQAWARLGDDLDPAGGDADLPRLVASPAGPVLVFGQRVGPVRRVQARRWDGQAWKPLGDGPLTGEDADLRTLGAGRDAGGAPVVACTTRPAGGGPASGQAFRWSDEGRRWEATPPPAVDGDTTRLEPLALPGGELLLASNWNPGLRALQRWQPGATSWSEAGLPGLDLAGRGYTDQLRLVPAGPDAVLAWIAGKVGVARYQGGAWGPALEGLGLEDGRHASQLTAAAAPDGKTVYLAWRDTSPEVAGIRVVAIRW